MPTRRQERVVRVVKEAVSNAINNHLSDPRIKGFVSVTRVDVAADLRSADVYLSIFGEDEKTQQRTFTAISHARSRIQSFLAENIRSKFCPVLHFKMDEKFKKTLDTLNIIDQAVSELQEKDSTDKEQFAK